MVVAYKAYTIEAFETETGRWRARIRRTDGEKIKVAVPAGDEHNSILTGGHGISFSRRCHRSGKEAHRRR